MSNHVRNVIELRGNKEDIHRFFKLVKAKEDDGDSYFFDFNRIIPIPENFHIEASTNAEIDYYIYCKMNNIKPFFQGPRFSTEAESIEYFKLLNYEWSKTGIEKYIKRMNYDVLKSGEAIYKNLANYGFPSLHEWYYNNWNTTCNSWKGEFDEENSIIRFTTVWNCPLPIAHKIAEMFPELSFVWTYADELIGNSAGRGYGKDKEFYICSDDDMSSLYDYYEYCWGECKCIYKDKDGKFQLHSCAECSQECMMKSMEIS